MFKMDNQIVWERMSSLTREHECWTYVKPTQEALDGHKAYWLLFNHYLGVNNRQVEDPRLHW